MNLQDFFFAGFKLNLRANCSFLELLLKALKLQEGFNWFIWGQTISWGAEDRAKVRSFFSRCKSINQLELIHWIPLENSYFPWKNISLEAEKKRKKNLSWGSQIQSQKLGVSSPSFQEFCHSSAIHIYLSFIYPFLGPQAAAKCANSEFWEGWTPPQLDFCPSGIDEFPTFPFLSAASGTGDKHLFEIPSSKVTAGDCPRWKFWGCFPEKAAGKME